MNNVGKARLPQPGQIIHCGLRAGQYDEVGFVKLGRLDGEPHPDSRLGGQRLGVGRVGDPRQPHHRDPQPLRPMRRTRPTEHPAVRERVLRVEPQLRLERQHPVRRAPGHRGEHLQPGLEHLRRAAEPVDDKAGDERLVGRVEHGERAEQGREHAAPVDVTHHDGGQVRRPGQAEVDVVVGPQVDLGGAARALTDHRVVLRPQLREARQRRLRDAGPHVVEVGRIEPNQRPYRAGRPGWSGRSRA